MCVSKNGTEKKHQREREKEKPFKLESSLIQISRPASPSPIGAQANILSAQHVRSVRSRWSALPWGSYNDEVCISHVTGTLIPYVSQLSNDSQSTVRIQSTSVRITGFYDAFRYKNSHLLFFPYRFFSHN